MYRRIAMEGIGISRWTRGLGGLLLALLSAVAVQAGEQLLLVAEPTNPVHRRFIDSFRATVAASETKLTITTMPPSDLAGRGPSGLEPGWLVVTVGSNAAKATEQITEGTAVINAMVTQAYFESHRPDFTTDHMATGRLSAIYVEQPLARRFALLARALPDLRRVGLLLGPWSTSLMRSLQEAAGERFQLVVEKVSTADEIVPALQRLLPQVDVLLAVPDPTVFNRRTAHSILLTSYRHRVPLVGYSKAFVRAGALLSLHSTPEQLGRQAAEMALELYSKDDSRLPPPAHPRYFAIAANRRVARSLSIHLPTNTALHQMVDEVSE